MSADRERELRERFALAGALVAANIATIERDAEERAAVHEALCHVAREVEASYRREVDAHMREIDAHVREFRNMRRRFAVARPRIAAPAVRRRTPRVSTRRARAGVARRARSPGRSADPEEPAPPLGRRHSRQTATKLRYAASSFSSCRLQRPQTGRPCSTSRSSTSQAAQCSSSTSAGRRSSGFTPSNGTPGGGRGRSREDLLVSFLF